MNFPPKKTVICVYADDEAVALLLPGVKRLKEIPAEGGAGVCEILLFVDEIPLVLAVD